MSKKYQIQKWKKINDTNKKEEEKIQGLKLKYFKKVRD